MAERQSKLRRVMARPAFRWLLIVYVAVAGVGVVFTFISDISVEREFAEFRLAMRQAEHSDLLEKLQQEIWDLESTLESLQVAETNFEEIQNALNTLDQFRSLQEVSVVSRLEGMEEKVEEIAFVMDEELEELKTILNPTNPEDILTVLRVGDKLELYGRELEALRRDVTALRTDLGERIELNHERALGRVDSITNTIGWMALLLVPVMLRAVRDFLPGRKQSDDSAKA